MLHHHQSRHQSIKRILTPPSLSHHRSR
jgi:hypothetical protein